VAVAGRILGEAYLRGRLTPTPDPDKAVFWWKRSGDAGDVPSIMLMANFYEGQFGFPELKNFPESIAMYGKAAGLGNANAMATLGSRLLSGDKSIRDEKKGREWLKKAVDAKEYAAYLALGDYEENINKDLKAALSEYERGKDAGQVDCMIRAANFYIEGKGVDKDPERGIAILKQAAEAGSPEAHLMLAAHFLSMEKPDMLVGYGHLLSAANGNLVEAQNELGLLYLSGKFAAADLPAGVAWLTRAAQNGNAAAQNNLAAIYENGITGVPRNLTNAGELYALAANQGHGPATFALARLVGGGIGTEPDPVKAWALASLAFERGVKEADKMVTDIGLKFTEEQRVAALKELARMKSSDEAKPAATKKDEVKK
jgi:TPR repeat protein